MQSTAPVGRVYQLNVSPGGLPKVPIPEARVTRLGLEGDAHHERTLHGGPYRAVCLFGIEAIERLQAEGHPTEPGGVGENLTTIGVDWSTLPGGTRIQVGDEVLLELTTAAMPCNTQRPNFRDGRFGRISILTHPSDSRMYASVVREGMVRTGDPITLLPPAPDSEGERAGLMARLDRVDQHSNLRLWRAAIAGGLEVHLLDDGELSAAATPSIPGPAFNNANGLRTMPHLLGDVTGHYERHGVTGWLPMHEPPWSGATADFDLAILAAPPATVDETAPPDGVTIRRLDPVIDADAWADVLGSVGEAAFPDAVTRALAQHLMATRDVYTLGAAGDDGHLLAVGTLHLHGRVGLLRAGVVRPEARGRGLQRALIAARAALAREVGCDMLTAQTGPGSISERNLERTGFERLGLRQVYRFEPS